MPARVGEWGNTAFVRAPVEVVRAALGDVVAGEGRVVVPAPAPRRPKRVDDMQYGDGASCALWGVGVLPGEGGWSMVQTAPLELLAETPEGSDAPRLAALARRLETDAVMLCMYDGVGLVLLEADAKGRIAVSGIGDPSRDPTRWQGRRIRKHEPRFTLADVPAEAKTAIGHRSTPRAFEAVADALGGDNARYAGNEIAVPFLVPHQPIEVAGAAVVYFARGVASADPRPPLAARFEELSWTSRTRERLVPEKWGGWPEGRRLRIAVGDGEMWMTGNAIVAPDRARGTALLEALGRWLGASAPAPADPPGLLAPVFCALERDGDALLLRIGERTAATLRLQVGPEGTIEEVDPADRERLLALLAPALRDGPGAKKKRVPDAPPLVRDFRRVTDDPAHVAPGAGFSADRIVAASWRGAECAVWIADEPGAPPRDLCAMKGVAAVLSPSPRSPLAAMCLTTPKGRPAGGIGSDDHAALVLVDLRTGTAKAFLAGEVDPFTGIVWAPDGERLALRVKAARGARVTRVVEVGRGRALYTTEPAAGLEPLAWDADGLLLVRRDFHAFGPPSFRRWRDGAAVEAVERYRSPDGRATVVPSGREVVCDDPDGQHRVKIGARWIAQPGQPPVWIGPRRLALRGDGPAVLDVARGTVGPLAPAARHLEPAAASASGALLLAFLGEGNLVWGGVDR